MPDFSKPAYGSSTVSGAYEEDGDLIVQFKSGGIYRYPGLGGYHAELMGSESPGKFVGRHLRGKHAVRVKADEDET